MLIERARACLLVVNLQDRLLAAVARPEPVLHHVGILVRAAKRLGMPILASEQYAKGLGPTPRPGF